MSNHDWPVLPYQPDPLGHVRIFPEQQGLSSLYEWNWVRGESSWAMGLLAVFCAADFAKTERWRTIGLWSVGGPDLDLKLLEGLGIT